MALDDLVQTKASPFTDEVLIAQTKKLIQRTFGVGSSDELGPVTMIDGSPTLTATLNDRQFQVTWSRDHKARVVWHVDGQQVLGIGGENALQKLIAALN